MQTLLSIFVIFTNVAIIKKLKKKLLIKFAQLAGAVEYTDCTFAEG